MEIVLTIPVYIGVIIPLKNGINTASLRPIYLECPHNHIRLDLLGQKRRVFLNGEVGWCGILMAGPS